MAVPVIQSYATGAMTARGTSVSCNKPSGVVTGDELRAIVMMPDNRYASMTPPAGWSLIAYGDASAGGTSGAVPIYVYGKTAGASEPASYSWTWTTSARGGGVAILRLTGAAAGAVEASAVAVRNHPTAYSPSVTTVAADALVLRLLNLFNISATGSPADGSSLVCNASGAVSGDTNSIGYVWSRGVATGGTAVGLETISLSSTNSAVGLTISIAPASGGGGTPAAATLCLHGVGA